MCSSALKIQIANACSILHLGVLPSFSVGPRGPKWCSAGDVHRQLLNPEICRLSWEGSVPQDTTRKSSRRQDLLPNAHAGSCQFEI